VGELRDHKLHNHAGPCTWTPEKGRARGYTL
jgi:hypothetical protein